MECAGKIRFSLFKKTDPGTIKLDKSVLSNTHKVCRLYDTCFKSLKDEVKMDVLIGLGCNGSLVSKMWHFLWLTLGLDVDKILRAAKEAPPPASSVSTSSVGLARGGSVSTVAAPEVIGQNIAVEMDPVFGVLTLCCQATQYRLM